MPDFKSDHPRLTNLLSFAAGALLPLAFAPFGSGRWRCYCPWSCSGVGKALSRAKPLAVADCFGLGLLGFGIYWIFISLHDYGNAPALFAAWRLW